MTDDRVLDSDSFLARYPRFLETSETGSSIERFEGRYKALIEANLSLIKDASILDLASHDGRGGASPRCRTAPGESWA